MHSIINRNAVCRHPRYYETDDKDYPGARWLNNIILYIDEERRPNERVGEWLYIIIYAAAVDDAELLKREGSVAVQKTTMEALVVHGGYIRCKFNVIPAFIVSPCHQDVIRATNAPLLGSGLLWGRRLCCSFGLSFGLIVAQSFRKFRQSSPDDIVRREILSSIAPFCHHFTNYSLKICWLKIFELIKPIPQFTEIIGVNFGTCKLRATEKLVNNSQLFKFATCNHGLSITQDDMCWTWNGRMASEP